MLPEASPGHKKQGVGVNNSIIHPELQADRHVVLLWCDKADSMCIYEVKLGGDFVMGGPNATVRPMALARAIGLNPEKTLLLKWVVATRRLSLAECVLPSV